MVPDGMVVPGGFVTYFRSVLNRGRGLIDICIGTNVPDTRVLMRNFDYRS